jgi:hypothetical protein
MRQFFTCVALSTFAMCATARAEYCQDQFTKDLTAANAESGSIMEWKKKNQDRAIYLQGEIGVYRTSIQNALTSSGIPDADKLKLISNYAAGQKAAQEEIDAITKKNAEYNNRLNDLKGNVPQALQDKAKECANKLAPANLTVNLVVQGLAIYYTGGLALLLPQKTLYVDMGEVLNGNVMGGPHSAPNEAKDWINGRLGTHF